jgi:uncharacterized protein (TIGR00725 family)
VSVALVGDGRSDPRLDVVAEEAGRRLAEAGAVLVCGGLGGVMAAACRGAVGAGGRTVGILPGTDRHESPPNPHVDVAVFSGLGQGRNLLVVLSGDAVLAIGGGWGTLSEIALARKHGRPVVQLAGESVRPPDGHQDPDVVPAATAEEAVELVLSLARRGR